MLIESYDFGRIIIDGKQYTSDLIVFPDRVDESWWRKKGHELCIDDIKEVIEAKPEILVVGTGYYGRMKILSETLEYLESNGIEITAKKTKDACEKFNQLSKSRKVVAAIHLTC
ncbi:MAG: Mth938-like domain-containing protein [Candidatus Hodarchaeota archaeon]